MKTTITIATMLLATTAYADATVGADIEAKVKKNSTTNQYQTVTKLGLSFDGDMGETGDAFGGFNFKSTDGNALALDEWNLGTSFGDAKISFGNQGGIFVEDKVDAEHASVASAAMKESIQVEYGNLEFALGLDDYKNDLFGNNDNVQAAYTVVTPVGEVKGSVDYNIDSTEYLYGARVDTAPVDIVGGATLGGIVTYGTEAQTLSYEANATAYGITAYVNGDENDMSENIGAGYEMVVGGLDLGTDLNYNFDAEEMTPQVTLGFSF